MFIHTLNVKVSYRAGGLAHLGKTLHFELKVLRNRVSEATVYLAETRPKYGALILANMVLGAFLARRRTILGSQEAAKRRSKRPPNDGWEASGTTNGRIACFAITPN